MATVVSASSKVAVAKEREIYGLTGDVKKDLLNYLDNIASASDFATMKSIPELAVNPEVRLLGSEDQDEVTLVMKARVLHTGTKIRYTSCASAI